MKYTKEMLESLVKESNSITAVMQKLGFNTVAGGTFAHIKRMIKFYEINISHFNGLGANKGKFIPRLKPKEVLIKRNGIYKEKSKVLLRAMLQAGVGYKCVDCGIRKWKDKFIRLHIEHKNGNNMDNRINNLEFLCPNCHSQTKTYAVKKNCETKISSEKLVISFAPVG